MNARAHITSTKEFVDLLKKEDELLEISEEIDPCLELAEIQRRVVAKKGKALLFTNVKGSPFSVATNLYGSQKRIELAFSKQPEQFIQQAVDTAHSLMPPNFQKLWQAKGLAWQGLKIGTRNCLKAPVLQDHIPNADVSKIPQLKCWPEDGGAFITLPLVYTEDPTTHKSNLGMYRIQLHNATQCGMHIQIHRGGGFHYYQAEKNNQSLPAHIYVGGPPALTISAVAPLPEDIPEILLASLLLGKPLKKTRQKSLSPLPVLSEADFCIIGDIAPHKRMPEGPFGDHYGYYSLKHDYPFMDVKHIFHRKNAIYPATVVGRPPQEDHFIACYLQDLLKPLIHMVMPQVRQVWAYEESGVHSLAGAVVKDRYPREALTTALRIIGEGQLSLTKFLMVTDAACDAKDFKKFFQTILERADFTSDLFILSQISQDTLDYTGPKVNEGSKAILLGIGDIKRELPKEFSQPLQHSVFKNPHVFCPGALVVEGPEYKQGDDLPSLLAKDPALENWPMVFLVDDAEATAKSAEDFLWHVFTRFEPAADIYSRDTQFKRYHARFSFPIVIDCRMKPWYPGVLESDKTTLKNLNPLLKKYGLDDA